MKTWFKEFTDEQKNILLNELMVSIFFGYTSILWDKKHICNNLLQLTDSELEYFLST